MYLNCTTDCKKIINALRKYAVVNVVIWALCQADILVRPLFSQHILIVPGFAFLLLRD